MSQMKISNILMTDYIVHEKLCNFRCKYCLGNETGKEREKLSSKETCKVVYEDGCQIETTLNTVEEEIHAEVLQISGGELFMIQNIDEFLIKKSKKYEKVIVLTNGCLLNEEIIDMDARSVSDIIPNSGIKSSLYPICFLSF